MRTTEQNTTWICCSILRNFLSEDISDDVVLVRFMKGPYEALVSCICTLLQMIQQPANLLSHWILYYKKERALLHLYNLEFASCKPYIPLQRENNCVGASRWAIPPMRDFCFANINMLVSRNPHVPNVTPHRPKAIPQREPMEYIGCVGSLRIVTRVGHVDFLFVSISFALGSQRERTFWWNMGLSITSEWL